VTPTLLELNIFEIFSVKFSPNEIPELITAISQSISHYRESKNPETQIKKSVYAILRIMNQNVSFWYNDFDDVFNTNQVKNVIDRKLPDELLETYKDRMSKFEGSNKYTLITNSVLIFFEENKSALTKIIENETRRENVIEMLDALKEDQIKFHNIATKKKEIFVRDHILEQEKDEPPVSAIDIYGAKRLLKDLNEIINGKIMDLQGEAHLDFDPKEMVSFIHEMKKDLHQTK
jgi:hypothetical protein